MTDVLMPSEVLTPTSFAGLRIEKPKIQTPHINVLIYGRSGVGKTTLAGSADAVPEMRKVLFVDVEAGTLALRKTDYNVDVIRITAWEQIDELYATLLAGSHEYNTIIFDSLTELQELNMLYVMAKMKEDPENLERDADIPGWTEWNKSGKHVKQLIRLFRNLPMNVIFTALMKEDKDGKTGIVMKLPDLPGKLAHRVAALFDIVLYYTVVESEDGQQRILASQSGTNTVAKNRGSDKLPAQLEMPPPAETAGMSIIYPLIVGSTNSSER